MATTANDLIDAAYRKCGILSPSAIEDENALLALNNMISLWGLELIIPSIIKEDFSLTTGDASYTIGTGATINSERPLMLANAYIRDIDNVDTPLKIVSGKEYNALTDKLGTGCPKRIYYYSSYPLGVLIFDTCPTISEAITYTCHLESWKNFTEYTSLTQTVSLPSEYKKAMIYNLAVELAEDNSISLSKSVSDMATFSHLLLSRSVAKNRLPGSSEFEFGAGGINPLPQQIPIQE